MMFKHTGHVCFCLNITSKNSNPMNLEISDIYAMSVVILDSILSECGKFFIYSLIHFIFHVSIYR